MRLNLFLVLFMTASLCSVFVQAAANSATPTVSVAASVTDSVTASTSLNSTLETASPLFENEISAAGKDLKAINTKTGDTENEKSVSPAVQNKTDERSESEIPLNLENTKKVNGEAGGALKLLLTLAILGVVGTGAIIFLKKYSVPKDRQHQTQIKILQQHYLGPKKSLAIVRVAGESILIGVTEHNISMIKSLALLDEDIPENTPANFENALQGENQNSSYYSTESANVRSNEKYQAAAVTLSAAGKSAAREDEGNEDFSMTGIKDIVSKRLKGMRSF